MYAKLEIYFFIIMPKRQILMKNFGMFRNFQEMKSQPQLPVPPLTAKSMVTSVVGVLLKSETAV